MVNYKLQYGLAAAIMLSVANGVYGEYVTVGYVKVDADKITVLDKNQTEVGSADKTTLCSKLYEGYARVMGTAPTDRIRSVFDKPALCEKIFSDIKDGGYFRITASIGFLSFLDDVLVSPIDSLTNTVVVAYVYRGESSLKEPFKTIAVRAVESKYAVVYDASDKNTFDSIVDDAFGYKTLPRRRVNLRARDLEGAVEKARAMAKERGGEWLVTIKSTYNAETGQSSAEAISSNVGRLPTRPVSAEKAAVAATVAATVAAKKEAVAEAEVAPAVAPVVGAEAPSGRGGRRRASRRGSRRGTSRKKTRRSARNSAA